MEPELEPAEDLDGGTEEQGEQVCRPRFAPWPCCSACPARRLLLALQTPSPKELVGTTGGCKAPARPAQSKNGMQDPRTGLVTGLERPLVHTRTTERGVQISKYCPSPGPSFAALASPSGLPRYPQDPASKGLKLDPAEGFPDPVLELQLVRVGNYFGDPCWPRDLEVQGVSPSCCCLGEQAAGALVIWLFWGWMGPLPPELPFPEAAPVFAFSLSIDGGARGLHHETRQCCSV